MNTEKRRIPFRRGIEQAERLVKLKALAQEAGHIPSWMTMKRTGQRQVTASDLADVNRALGTLGWQISCARLSPLYPNPEGTLAAGDDLRQQVRSLQAVVNMRHIYEDIMGKHQRWFDSRTNDPRYRFTDDEVETINQALHDIGTALMQMQLVENTPTE